MKAFTFFIMASLLMACNSKGKQDTNEKQDTTNKTEGAAPVAANKDQNKVQLTDAQMKNAVIETGHLEKKNISSVLKLNGSIDVPPQNMVSVSVPLGGYLKSTQLLPGMHIARGATIAVMEDQQYIQLQQDYLTAKAKLLYAEQEYNRQRDLNQSKASSDKVYQQAQMDYTAQKILVKIVGGKAAIDRYPPGPAGRE